MAKQQIYQQRVLKLSSEYILWNKKDVHITLQEARDDQKLIPLFDSTAIRMIDICYKKQYSRRVYSGSSYKINSFRWEKATKFINMGKLRYESSDDLVPVIKEYFSSRLREGVSMKYEMKKILKEEGF